MGKGAAQRDVARKEGLQPLTHENLAEFHEEEESWEDPKDYGTPFPSRYSQSHSAWPNVFPDNFDSICVKCHSGDAPPIFGVLALLLCFTAT